MPTEERYDGAGWTLYLGDSLAGMSDRANGLACLERGRRFIGFEDNAEYVAEGLERLRFGRFPRRPPPAQPEAQATLLGI